MRRLIFYVLVIIWMVVIFSFSAKNADESTEESNKVGMWVGGIVHSDFETWSEEEQLVFAEKWDHPIRKCAHMTEYAILGFFLFGAYVTDKEKWRKCAIYAFLTAVLYAVTDEMHQYFVPGRACMVTDVGFDSVGAFVGCMISVFLFVKMLNWKVRTSRR